MNLRPWEAALDDLEAALDDLESGVADRAAARPAPPWPAHRLVAELTRQWERTNHRRLTKADDDGDDEPPRPALPLPSPSEVLDRWRRGGAGWLRSASRLDLRATMMAAQDPSVGPELLADVLFWPAIEPRLRERRADQVLNAAYFHVPGHPWVEPKIRARALAAPRDVPQWWITPGPALPALAGEVARRAGSASYSEVLGALGLPEVLPESFLTQVAEASQAIRASELASLRTFVDRGREMGSRATIFDATRAWARRATRVGERFPAERLAIAELLRGRIGELNSGRDDGRWSGLERERGIARRWLIGEVFRVVFSHLVPEGAHAHMTEPRRKFWVRYDHTVERIWLLVCDEHRHRLDGDEAIAKLRLHGILDVVAFTGQKGQDALWMHLRSARGDLVTVMEGNANMPIRIRRGAHLPPSNPQGGLRATRRIVEYDLAKSTFPEDHEPWKIPHGGFWESRARNALIELDISPSGAR